MKRNGPTVATVRSVLHDDLIGWFAGALLGAAVLTGVAAETVPSPQDQPTVRAPATSEIQLRGRVVCLAEEMHRLHRTDLPGSHEHLYGFKATNGMFYTLLRTKFSEALFVDKHLHEKELILKGRLFPSTQIFEPTTLRSIRNGVVYDLYYYCEICNIQMVAPGKCECCQGPVELVEKPLTDR